MATRRFKKWDQFASINSYPTFYRFTQEQTGKEDDEEEAEILADEKKMMTRGFGRRKLLPTVL
eukprot:scaffold27038_cov131-Skeletonema_marinoi.AAC.2